MKDFSLVLCASWVVLTCAPNPAFTAPVTASPPFSSASRLRTEIEAHTGRNFEGLLKRWETSQDSRQLGANLVHLSQETTLSDRARYIAIQGAARLARKTSSPATLGSLERLGKDSSWLVRTGVLKAFEQEDPARAARLAQELLDDSALVVRLEALSTLEKIRPRDLKAQRSLLKAAEDPRNWQGNRPLWIPERAVMLLGKLRNRSENSSAPLRSKIESLKKELF